MDTPEIRSSVAPRNSIAEFGGRRLVDYNLIQNKEE